MKTGVTPVISKKPPRRAVSERKVIKYENPNGFPITL